MKTKNLYLSVAFLLVAITAYAQEFKEGTLVDKYPKVEWLKGDPVTDLDPSKIYIVECWATWCGPCRAAMPHLSELHRKYGDKVIFIGQNVRETDLEKVKEFVHGKGDQMAYRVAYAGNTKSDFMQNWYLAAGIEGIPTTIIIKNNRVVWITHPDMLSEAIMKHLIADDFSRESALNIWRQNDEFSLMETYRGKNYEEALHLADKILSGDPFNSTALMLKDGILEKTGRQEEREKFLKETHEVRFDGTVSYLYYGKLMQDERFQTIIELVAADLKRAKEENQERLNIIANGYTAYMKNGNTQGAIDFLRSIIAENRPDELFCISILWMAAYDVTPTPELDELFFMTAMKYLNDYTLEPYYLFQMALYYFDKQQLPQAIALVDAEWARFLVKAADPAAIKVLEQLSRKLHNGERPGEEDLEELMKD